MDQFTSPHVERVVMMTVRELALFLRLSPATVYRLAKTHKIPALKIGRAWRFERSRVEEWLRRNSDAIEDPSL